MKNTAMLLIMLISIVMIAASQPAQEKMVTKDAAQVSTIKGYLVDQMCAAGMIKKGPEQAMDRAKKHTKDCTMHEECRASGFGLVTGAKFIKFDAAGDTLAIRWLENTVKKDNLFVEATGVVEGEMMKVKSIAEPTSESKKKQKGVDKEK